MAVLTDNLITWNIRNWITVFLMFLAGWAVIALGVRLVRGKGSVAGMSGGQQVGGYSGGAGM
jgi:hypothetical protein